MSTRCQICVHDKSEKVTLYRHCDGYPEAPGVVGDIKKIFDGMGESWHKTRAGYVASNFCAFSPDGIQPLGYHDLHGDIEFYYKVDVNQSPWKVKVFGGGYGSSMENLLFEFDADSPPDDATMLATYQ